ncbi:MAG: flagellar export chaperone FliS [Planctomycetales bacterium]
MTGIDAYLETRVLTATPEQLHLMVVDAAIRHARKGEEALKAQDREVAFFALNKARACVDELLTGLDDSHTPEVVENLKQLFLFVHRNLRLADIQQDSALAGAGLKILEMHRETWLQLMQRLAEEGAASRPASVSSGAGLSLEC